MRLCKKNNLGTAKHAMTFFGDFKAPFTLEINFEINFKIYVNVFLSKEKFLV